jgi:hypothetical protein
LNEPLFLQAFEDYRSHADKEWSLTDGISFHCDEGEKELQKPLQRDSDFEQAGFTKTYQMKYFLPDW